jgi:hypothetical protein
MTRRLLHERDRHTQEHAEILSQLTRIMDGNSTSHVPGIGSLYNMMGVGSNHGMGRVRTVRLRYAHAGTPTPDGIGEG